jgi:hypothetical protein
MRTLEECEIDIRKGFAIAGKAFKEIRDNKLYKANYSRFEDYCQNVWQYGKAYVNRLIAASETMDNLQENGANLAPNSEGVIRPLTVLPKEQQAEAWEKAVEASPKGKPTAKEVSNIVSMYTGKPVKFAKPILHPTKAQLRQAEKEMDIRHHSLERWNDLIGTVIHDLESFSDYHDSEYLLESLTTAIQTWANTTKKRKVNKQKSK